MEGVARKGVAHRRSPPRTSRVVDTLHHQLLRYGHMYMWDAGLIATSLAQHADLIENVAKGDIAGAERAVRANCASGLAAVIAKIRQR